MTRSVRRAVLGALLLAAPLSGGRAQTPVRARAKRTLTVAGQTFKDLNANGRLDPYEDWRLPTDARVKDLLGRMTLEEKAGMLLINTLNAEAGGKLSERGVQMIQDEKMTRFIFRNTVVANPVAASAEPPAGGGRGGRGGGGGGNGPRQDPRNN